ncbi:MAG: helix-turn-helix domain-containing protein [Dehalococcoidia bacterium]|nr:helix-turn-helix domain-containing protein [Dehalococcoidia bacterium]
MEEAARLLDVSPATIWRWIDQARLPASRIGPRKIRIWKKDLETVIRPARPKPAMNEFLYLSGRPRLFAE